MPNNSLADIQKLARHLFDVANPAMDTLEEIIAAQKAQEKAEKAAKKAKKAAAETAEVEVEVVEAE